MANEISKIKVGSIEYLVKDNSARAQIESILADASVDYADLGKIQGKIEDLYGDLIEKVDSVTGSNSITIGGTSTEPVVSLKVSAEEGNALQVKTDGVFVLIPAAAEYTITKKADSGDYAAVYQLTKDGSVVGADINIPKDMVISKAGLVEYDGTSTVITIDDVEYTVKGEHAAGKYIVMIIANGDNDQVWLNVEDLVDEYTAGAGIDIADNVISAAVADSSACIADDLSTGKNFLKINDDDKLEVKGVDADATVVAKDITVEGGVWAEDVKQAFPDGVPAGTTLQSFLEKMLCVEKWGAPSQVAYSFTATVSAPAADIKNGSTSVAGKSVPVGTIVDVSKSAGSMTAKNEAKITGYTYGYSVDGASKTSAATTYNATITAPTQTGEISTSGTWNGGAAVDGATDKYYVKNGEQSWIVSESGKVVTRGTVTDADVYNVSNLGNVRDDDKKSVTDEAFQAATQETITPTNSTTKKVTGYYPVYYGPTTIVTGDIDPEHPELAFTPAVIKALGDTHSAIPGSTTVLTTSIGDGGYICAIKGSTKTDMKMLAKSDASPMGQSQYFDCSIGMANDFETVTYRVFYITGAAPMGNPGEWYMTIS